MRRRAFGFGRRFIALNLYVLLPATVSLAAGQNAADPRDEWQQPSRVVHDLNLKPGATVADIGCGTGYLTFWLARAVGEKGKVFATDISANTLKNIRDRIEREHLTNIETIQSAPTETKLKPDCCDSALLCQVLHEVPEAQRQPLVQSVAKAIKPGGFLFIIDWKKSHEAPQGVHFDPYDQKIPREDLVKMAANAGLQLDAEFLYLKYQVFLRFRKPLNSSGAKEGGR